MNRAHHGGRYRDLTLLAAFAWLLQMSLPGLSASPAHPARAAAAAVALGWCSSNAAAAVADRATVTAPADDSSCLTGCCVAGPGTPPVLRTVTAAAADAAGSERPAAAGWRGAVSRWSGPARVRGPPAGNA